MVTGAGSCQASVARVKRELTSGDDEAEREERVLSQDESVRLREFCILCLCCNCYWPEKRAERETSETTTTTSRHT